MKRVVSIFAFALLLKVSLVSGQESLKIGHVNIQEILQQLPETDSIQVVMKNEADEMEKMFGEMINEHDMNLKKFEAEKDTYSEFVRTSKETDLVEMSSKIQQFQQTANQQLQKRNMELIQPVYAMINEAIEKVALKNGFTYILDLTNGTVAFHSPSSKNLNADVLHELGIVNH